MDLNLDWSRKGMDRLAEHIREDGELPETPALMLLDMVVALRAKLAEVEQDRDRLAAEVENAKAELEQPACVNCHIGLNERITDIEAQLTAAQEENKRLAGCLKASEKYAEGVKADFDKALNQLTAAQQECKHLKEGVSAMEFFLNDVAAALDVSLTAPGRTFAIMAAISFICTRAERAEAQLTTAQQSAQEQLELAVDAANEWAMQYVEIDNAPMRVGDFIQAELSKGERK